VSTFPDSFLWGAATAGHQVEGGNINNDHWVLEHTPGSPWMGGPSGDACDHYHRYPEDIALLADLGLNTYRFSLEWSRIEPEEGEFSRAALAHYRRVLETCHEHGVTPFVTLVHLTGPRWLAADGGWEDSRTPERYARFCERAMAALGDLIPYVCTFNEPNSARLLFDAAPAGFELPRDMRSLAWFQAAARAMGSDSEHCMPIQFAGSDRALEIILAAHRRGIEAVKSARPDCLVGLSLAMQGYEAVQGGEEKLRQIRARVDDAFLDALEPDDYVGVQTYARAPIGPHGPVEPEEGLERTGTGQQFSPESLGDTILYAAQRTGLPVIVTENGICTDDDTRRIEYIQRAVRAVERRLAEGVRVLGYIHWSLLDNFEWVFGFGPKYGLVAVDRETFRRTPKPSARFYGEIARRNGL
jgi:beta-glucosidase